MKPSAPARPKELTPEEKAAQVARFLSQKREAFALSFFAGLAQQRGILQTNSPRECAEAAVEAADALLEKLYPLATEAGEGRSNP